MKSHIKKLGKDFVFMPPINRIHDELKDIRKLLTQNNDAEKEAPVSDEKARPFFVSSPDRLVDVLKKIKEMNIAMQVGNESLQASSVFSSIVFSNEVYEPSCN